MGYGGFSPTDYNAGVRKLRASGQVFARSAQAQATGNFGNIAKALDPRKLKNGVREACFAAGFTDALPIVVSIDGTGSMDQVPFDIQKGLPDLIKLVTDQGISDHPNVLFMCHDDEHAVPPDAAFQMGQFETDAPKLLEALNELIIPHNGGGNQGEAYHLSIYAAAYHTRLEAFERDGTKGFFFMICDEEPYYRAGDPKINGTTPEIAQEVFGDKIEATVSMLQAMKKLCERYHVFIIRPGHTSHGTNKSISKLWQDLLRAAGENPENVLEIAETEAIIPTMALTIGGILGADKDEIVDVLRTQGVSGLDMAVVATKGIMPKGGALAKIATASTMLPTTTGTATGRRRR